jgi:hypothetical protein
MALMGSVGEGVLGPWEEATEVYEEMDPGCEALEAMELTRGDEVPEEYA